MTPDDPRHGTVAGHVAHQRSGAPLCQPCIHAKAAYDKRRVWATLNGRGYTVPSLGAQRRVQALQTLGWSRPQIARAAGWGTSGALRYLDRSDTITRRTHERIAEAYERLCMTHPPADDQGAIRARTWARKHGYAPPLAWDDIDDPDEEPLGVVGAGQDDSDDEMVVERILAGDWRLKANRDQRLAVIERWVANGGSQNALERLTGWNTTRDLRDARKDAAA